MRRRSWRLGATIAFILVVACWGNAQTVNLWPGVAPGSEKWTYKETSVNVPGTGTVLFGVTTPTLTAYLPEKSKATGTGVIIAPGGAFVALAIDVEGNEVARWLNERGIAAFVLKYRIMEKKGEGLPKDMNWDEAAKYGIADGVQAIKLVRQHSTEWGVVAGPSCVPGILGGGDGDVRSTCCRKMRRCVRTMLLRFMGRRSG